MIGCRVLVADADAEVRTALDGLLRHEGYTVELATNGAAALVVALTGRADVIIMAGRMRPVDGYEACRTLRGSGSRLPILMLAEPDAAVDALEAGADDCVVRPFRSSELLARLRAVVGRTAAPAGTDVLRHADVTLNRTTREVHRGNRPVGLTRTEFNLLDRLMSRAGQTLSRQDLFREVWGHEAVGSNNVDVYIGYLRRKLEQAGEARLVHTVRGVGFVFR